MRAALRRISVEFIMSACGRGEAVAAPASFFTDATPPAFPSRTVARGDLPEELLDRLPTTKSTDSRDVIDL